MHHRTDITTRRSVARALAGVLSIVLAVGVVSPAVATTVDEPREPVAGDTTLDAARVSSGADIAPAAVAADFNPGYLISDYAFYNRFAMTEEEIQAFLDARLPGPCTTPYCLAIYSMTTTDKPVTERCNGYTGAPNESAARIIYKVQLSCGISAKVILVTLQKEQSLITRTAPTDRTLERAMGYFCPDDPSRPGWCDPRYAGLFNQVYNAAAQFQRYRLQPTSYGHQVRTQAVRYHPNAACGSRTVTIVNNATAGLYNYTPYTPNAAALNNLYGLGDSCSSYGNRNFWRLYTDWFGSPTTLVPGGVATERVAGADRWATAASISAQTYPTGASTVYIAVGTRFADGLAAAPAASIENAPLLLVGSTAVPAPTAAELQRLNPSTVRIVGGEAVVSAAVRDQLQALLPSAEITRYAGPDRYRTAEEIARQAFSGGAMTVFLATGGGFADALAASAAAGSMGAPVLLVAPGARELDPATVELITALGATRIIVIGGTSVITPEVQSAAGAIAGVTVVERLGGSNRFETAAIINDFAFPTAERAFIASGLDFPDALAAAAAAGNLGAPLHLSNGVCTYTPSLQHLIDAGVDRVSFTGGPNVLGSTVTEFLTCG